MDNRKKELVDRILAADTAYYNEGRSVLTDREYDALKAELAEIEAAEGGPEPDSPTLAVGAPLPTDEGLQRFRHPYPCQSLDKTKDGAAYVRVFQFHAGMASSVIVVLMWKLDGLTLQLYYKDGVLVHAVTRGNGGEVGLIVDHNARYITGIPQEIPYKGELVVRGEALMTFAEFERIKAEEEDAQGYANARNLCAPTVQFKDEPKNARLRGRQVLFKAFQLVHMEDGFPSGSFSARLDWLDGQGFDTVGRMTVPVDALPDAMAAMDGSVPALGYPVDGLVCALDDCDYAAAQKSDNAHHPHQTCGYAFKWEDESVETRLVRVHWQAGRTGLLTPVAEFEPRQIEGTTVARATLCNVSELRRVLGDTPFVGQALSVYKANKIIPKALPSGDRTAPEGAELLALPTACPACGGPVVLEEGDGCAVLRCVNPECPAKHVKRLAHLCERDCLDIRGLSESTVEKLAGAGHVREFADFWHLGEHPEIAGMEGFGDKSLAKMQAAAEKARECDFVGFVHGIGIPMFGKGQAKMLKKHLLEDPDIAGSPERSQALFKETCRLILEGHDFTAAEGIGKARADALVSVLTDEVARDVLGGGTATEIGRLCREVRFKEAHVAKPKPAAKAAEAGAGNEGAKAAADAAADAQGEAMPAGATSAVAGKTFVVTGAVRHFANRDALHADIEARGGKTAGSVSKKTDYLINNDKESATGKNKKARELGVPVITEDEYMAMAGGAC